MVKRSSVVAQWLLHKEIACNINLSVTLQANYQVPRVLQHMVHCSRKLVIRSS